MKSKVETRASFTGENISFIDWADRQGPTGGRNVLEGIWIHANFQTDVTVAVIKGQDLARIWGRVIITQHDGVQRYNLAGDQARVCSYAFEGADRYSENADLAVAAAQQITMSMYLPFRKRFAHTPEDYSLPVDWLKSIEIQQPSNADLTVGGTFALSGFGMRYWVTGEYREDHDVQLYNVDRVYAQALSSLTEGVINVNGKLHDLYFHARGANGGASLANLTDARVDELGISPLLRTPDLLTVYRRKRGLGNNLNSTIGGELRSDPFVNTSAMALLLHDDETATWDGKILRTAHIGMTNTVASVFAIARTVVPTSETIRNQTNAAYGLTPASYGVATKAKTKQDIRQWPQGVRPFLRLKAALPKAA